MGNGTNTPAEAQKLTPVQESVEEHIKEQPKEAQPTLEGKKEEVLKELDTFKATVETRLDSAGKTEEEKAETLKKLDEDEHYAELAKMKVDQNYYDEKFDEYFDTKIKDEDTKKAIKDYKASNSELFSASFDGVPEEYKEGKLQADSGAETAVLKMKEELYNAGIKEDKDIAVIMDWIGYSRNVDLSSYEESSKEKWVEKKKELENKDHEKGHEVDENKEYADMTYEQLVGEMNKSIDAASFNFARVEAPADMDAFKDQFKAEVTNKIDNYVNGIDPKLLEEKKKEAVIEVLQTLKEGKNKEKFLNTKDGGVPMAYEMLDDALANKDERDGDVAALYTHIKSGYEGYVDENIIAEMHTNVMSLNGMEADTLKNMKKIENEFYDSLVEIAKVHPDDAKIQTDEMINSLWANMSSYSNESADINAYYDSDSWVTNGWMTQQELDKYKKENPDYFSKTK